jgi:hypothetical protein
MQQSAVRASLSALLVLQAAIVSAQTTIDLHQFKPREVKSAVFTLSSAQDVRVEAVGAEPSNNNGTFSWLTTMWSGNRDDRREPWTGNAWILDLSSRKVAWELSAAQTDRGRRGTREFNGTVRLPAGTYEVFYAAFPNIYVSDDNDPSVSEKFMNWLADTGFDEFRVSVRGDLRTLSGADADRARLQFENGSVIALRGDGAERFAQTGFTLDRSTQVDIYAEGEIREDGEFDSGWIINADTHQPVWKMTWRDSSPAGGAEKNRVSRLSTTLPAGRYAAFYATDDSHDTSAWNSAPPRDPHAWGLFIRVADAARAGVKTFAYEHVPESATLVALTKIGDEAFKSRGFTLSRPTDVRIYAIGEGSGGRMVDYGWIADATTRQKVWEMRYDDTESAGGAPKNRLVDRTIRLEKGDYVVNYISDDSHSYDEWNASAPRDGKHWGITLLAARGASDRSAFSEYAEKPDSSVLAQLVRVRDDAAPRTKFVLDRETRVRVYALGESSGRSLADYGWIEDARTGKTVWEMSYRLTDRAGGAEKNRKFDGVITLPAGEYTLRYETDESHAFGGWNAAAPDDPEMWGITLFRVR